MIELSPFEKMKIFKKIKKKKNKKMNIYIPQVRGLGLITVSNQALDLCITILSVKTFLIKT